MTTDNHKLPVTEAASESTKIEQSRAVAEVQAAVVIAMKYPRDTSKAHAKAMESCLIDSLAERAFFSYPKGGQTVTGASIHLATELARCWGNIDYGIKELSRDDEGGSSEILAFAWDLETNVRSETVFVVPHKMDTKHGGKILTQTRDIYENNANMGARRIREMIFRVLPPWLIDDAKRKCRKTLEHGGGVPIEKRRSLCIMGFEKLNITQDQLEAKMGKPISKLTDVELANLNIAGQSLKTGELNRDEFLEGAEVADLSSELKEIAKQDAPVTSEASPPRETKPEEEAKAGGDSATNQDPPVTQSEEIEKEFPFDPVNDINKKLNADEMVGAIKCFGVDQDIRFFIHMHTLFMNEMSKKDQEKVYLARDNRIKELS